MTRTSLSAHCLQARTNSSGKKLASSMPITSGLSPLLICSTSSGRVLTTSAFHCWPLCVPITSSPYRSSISGVRTV